MLPLDVEWRNTMSLSPYFAALARQKRICPRCQKRGMRLEENPIDPNIAYFRCECGYMTPEYAPRKFCIDRDAWLRQKAIQESKTRIIKPKF